MFPLNPWGRRKRKKWTPTWHDVDVLLASYRLAFAAFLFQCGLFLLPLLALFAWTVVTEDAGEAEWVVLGGVTLVTLLLLWLTWRFMRGSWFALRACLTP